MTKAEQDAISLDSVDEAIAAIARGEAVVVVDDVDRENEGDLIFAAELATPELVSFMVRYSSGYICAALESEKLDALALPAMVAQNQDQRQTAYAVTVDLADGSTGISARSRAATIRRLADPEAQASEFTRPGHVVPLRARAGGVLARDGHTEAAVDLARLAGMAPAGVLCEIVSEDDPTDMARAVELRRFADIHGLKMIAIDQLKRWRIEHDRQVVRRKVSTTLPTEFGTFQCIGYQSVLDGLEHVALVKGDVRGKSDVLVRVHSECLTGDVFASRRCDCGEQLHAGMRAIESQGEGVLLYLRGHEGRGIGLMEKLEAYKLQEDGADTVDANLALGLAVDARDYAVAAMMLHDLEVQSIALLSNNPQKPEELAAFGIRTSVVKPLRAAVHEDNRRYLETKRDRMGHQLPWLDEH
ncbi:bifunctional 3,4-dihydroxy-2-butanone-4-phosphate synthase/GTP cyclohydrolase II [Corynebacterium gerontici]|uniref:Riboflavin biosynthesis protein RibBA n=1 Tax=Corynebacterium gerontici TaxID=2079234 RepID=A0A3G6J652_9CORY|nr:bifunctional 3,4-dihydroxy-2-butanone-4-phosphate synthase/GTP cyclohydrolase II [Corynebacterium gerontici]AZA11494.1 Riboflavin biosynthesis protein RibBA [Corynebacterium gerontici]